MEASHLIQMGQGSEGGHEQSAGERGAAHRGSSGPGQMAYPGRGVLGGGAGDGRVPFAVSQMGLLAAVAAPDRLGRLLLELPGSRLVTKGRDLLRFLRSLPRPELRAAGALGRKRRGDDPPLLQGDCIRGDSGEDEDDDEGTHK